MKNIIPAALILISIFGFNFLIRPIYDRTPTLLGEIVQYESALKKAQDLSGLVAQVGEKYNGISGDLLSRLDKVVPAAPNNMQLVADISAVAARFGASVKSFQIGGDSSLTVGDSASSPYAPTAISFSFSSSYPNFIQFMKDLEDSLRIMDIYSISFASGDKSIYDYKVSLAVYSTK